MRARWPVLAIVLGLGTGYLGYPYVTLYRLDHAVRGADAATLGALVDWYAVREGLKEDLCDLVLEEPSTPATSSTLPPFGAGFVRGVAGTMVDQNITPESVVSMTHAGPADQRGDAHVAWAFFSHPTRFSVAVLADGTAEPIRVEMQLRNLRWRVHRVWLPNTLLERASFGT